MTKHVLDVGNCPPDHAAICRLIESQFDAVVLQAHHAADALSVMRQQPIDLVLVNRKLDQDYSDGLAVIRQIKRAPELANIPVMLITNYEDHQQQAVEAGAERGFGKLSLRDAQTRELLSRFLA
jgi:two-component system chemotaxis response regulator CheY